MARYYRRRRQSGSALKGRPFLIFDVVTALGTLIFQLLVWLFRFFVWAIRSLIRCFKKKKHSSEWDFLYTEDQAQSDSYSASGIPTETKPDGTKPNSKKYSTKQMVSQCELNFMAAIREVLNEINPEYILTPQVNLTSIIQRSTRYANELFRNVDFGVFDQEYRVVVLIEINDKTHEQYERRDRDHKVKAILAEAGIPLITLWTKYGIDKAYIKERLSEYCKPVLTT